jgi:ribosomal protein S18 acetylase RimI-like enzyme
MKTNDEELCFQFCDYENSEHLKNLAELICLYMEDPMGGSPAPSKLQQLRMIDGLANHPTAFVLFAISGHEVLGLTVCFENFSTFQAKAYVNIHDIIVRKEHRGKGIGKALLQEVEKIASERKYCKITLEVREDNRVAQALYKSLGFGDCQPPMYFWTKQL